MSDFVKSVKVDVANRSVNRQSTVRYVKGGAEHQMAMTYDFAGLGEETLLELASRTVHIAYQGMCRGDRNLPLTGNFDVLEWVTSERRGGGFKVTAKGLGKMAQKLSAEDKRALLERLQAELAESEPEADDEIESENDADDESDADTDTE